MISYLFFGVAFDNYDLQILHIKDLQLYETSIFFIFEIFIGTYFATSVIIILVYSLLYGKNQRELYTALWDFNVAKWSDAVVAHGANFAQNYIANAHSLI